MLKASVKVGRRVGYNLDKTTTKTASTSSAALSLAVAVAAAVAAIVVAAAATKTIPTTRTRTTIDDCKKDFIHGLFTVKFKNIVFYQEKISRDTSVLHVQTQTHSAQHRLAHPHIVCVCMSSHTFALEKMKQINKWEGFFYILNLYFISLKLRSY